jgi:integrase
MQEIDVARITKKAVDALHAGDRDRYGWDDEIRGFGVKVTPRGRKVYLYQYRYPRGRAGRTRRVSIGAHGNLAPDQARRRARSLAAAVAEGRDPYADEVEHRRRVNEEMTVAQLAVRWLDAFEAKVRAGDRSQRTLDDYRKAVVRMLVPRLGSRRVKTVSRHDVALLKPDLVEGYGVEQAHHALRALSAMMAHGMAIGQLGVNPATGQGQFTTRRRERFLSEAELARLGDALRRAEAEGLPPAPQERGNYHDPKRALVPAYPPAVAAIRMLLLTGMRRGEVLGLCWGDVDLVRGELVLQRHKTARRTGEKRVPITPLVAEVLEAARSWRTSEYVFPGRKPDSALVGISKVWDRIRRAADLSDVRLHDLRHTFASMGVSQGVGLSLVGSLLGHADPVTTHRYAHLHDDPRRQAAETISTRVQSALAGDISSDTATSDGDG